MTAIINHALLEPLQKSELDIVFPPLTINGKLTEIDWRKDQRHFFRFLEIIPKLLKPDISKDIFTNTILHYQKLNDLLLESHISDDHFSNGDMLAYFLALLDHHTVLNNREIQEKNLLRVLRYWGIDDGYEHFYSKISQAKHSLSKAELLKFDPRTSTKEIETKFFQIASYLENILPEDIVPINSIKSEVLELIDKRLIPCESALDAAITMIVVFFPKYIPSPTTRFYALLHLKREMKINLRNLYKNVYRYMSKLERRNIL